MKAKTTIGVLAVTLLLVAGAYLSLCACVTLVDVAYHNIRTELHHVMDAQQAYFTGHQRYARTLDELGYLKDSPVTVRVVVESDSSIRISGTWARMPDFTRSCSIRVTPGIRSMDRLMCTR